MKIVSSLARQLSQRSSLTIPATGHERLMITRTLADGYLAQKAADKDRRRQLYHQQQERQKRLKNRRVNRPPNQKRADFREWFFAKKVDEEYMSRKARQAGMDWKMQVAVVLERTSVVLPDKEDWEIEYENLYTHLQQFGKVYPKDLVNADYEATPAITDEELMQFLPKGFEPAPRETAADASGDVRTTDRKLKTSIFLTVQQNGKWQFPTVELQEDETLLAAAKRAIPEAVGDQVEFWCLSNAPVAVDMVALPEAERKQTSGTKTFFMKIQYDEGLPTAKSVEDYAWLDRGEVVERVQKEQGDRMSKFYHYLL